MRHRQAFQTDIFCKFDLENDLLTMTLTYNHFENKFNQLRHPGNPTIHSKIVQNRTMDSKRYATFALRLAAMLDLAEKEG